MTKMRLPRWRPPEVRRLLWQVFLLIAMATGAWILLKEDLGARGRIAPRPRVPSGSSELPGRGTSPSGS